MLEDDDDDDEIELTEEEEAEAYEAFLAAHDALMASDPEYRSIIERIANEDAAREARPSQSAKKAN